MNLKDDMMNDFETVILRFRDLSTSPGMTIDEHTKMIDNGPRPYVWWAWWNKHGEKVPENSLRKLKKIIDDDGMVEVFLFDSGSGSFYRSRVTDIDWDKELLKIPSPEYDKTPSYYRDIEYYAWFKMEHIEEVDKEQVVDKYSYVRVDEFFDSGESLFTEYYDKVVFSLNELRHQERTIWFVRKKLKTDLTHRVKMYDSGRVFPANFPESAITAKEDTFLWLSDLHFSDDFHAFPMREDESVHKVSLLECIDQAIKAEGLDSLGGIIITGDFTWRASKEEFETALSFLHDAMSRFSLTKNQIFVCPGNHDICFAADSSDKNAKVEKAPEEAKEGFVEFYKNLYGINPNEWLCSGKRVVTGSGFCLDIVSFNSSYLTQKENVFQGHGFVGKNQRDHVQKKMGWDKSDIDAPKTFRVAAMHHHLIPVLSETPRFGDTASTVYDASAMLDWFAENEINLVLHGHMHHTHEGEVIRNRPISSEKQRFHIVSMGSSGVVSDKLPEGANNTISLIKFKRSAAKIKTIRVTPDANNQIADQVVFSVDIPYEKV